MPKTKITSDAHLCAILHVTGSSEFIDDKIQPNEVYCELIYSPYGRARILSLDTSKALNHPLVSCVITAKDVKENKWGAIFKDQPLLAEKEVYYAGEVVAIIATKDRTFLPSCRNLIQVEWERLEPILSIDEAIQKKSFIADPKHIIRGDIKEGFSLSDFILKDRLIIRGAEHFYLENQSALAIPLEGGQLEIHSSTQHPTETQHVVAKACGLRFADVHVIAKRLGGGFGGKESQAAPFAAYAALVAQKIKKPARIVLTKDDDMILTGKRNPFQIDYTYGFKKDGSLVALEADLYSDGGAYADLSTAIMERALLHSDNAYYISHVKLKGQVCRTNFHPHTAFRGFGGPKGVCLIETIMEDMAFFLKKDALDLRKKNCYQKNNLQTPYGQKVENNLLPKIFEKLEKTSDYQNRRKAIADYNAKDQIEIKGLSLTAVKFGISFTTRFLNQGSAFIILQTDGSVCISTGAVEMGQGVHTKISLIVSETFGISTFDIKIMPTRTDKNANTSPTAASSGTDINGAAALRACRKIKKKLSYVAMCLAHLKADHYPSQTAALASEKEIFWNKEDYEKQKISYKVIFKNKKVYVLDKKNLAKILLIIDFKDLIQQAYLSRISLSAYAHYKTPFLDFNKITGKGRAFLYYTQGACACEVSINKLTGEVKVRRVDILMDLGQSLSCKIDYGQIYGAFVQGMGWLTCEQLVYDQHGKLITCSPSTYKIPSIQDMPREFYVNLIKNPSHKISIKGSKAVGEPPLLLAISVFTAIKNAIYYKKKSSQKKPVNLKIPAQSEEILFSL